MSVKIRYFWNVWSGLAINHMKISPSSVASDKYGKLPFVFVIIPGNPGCIHFYEKFAEVLCVKTNIPVWGVSHTGHANAGEDGQLGHPETLECGLEKQIEHKIEYLEKEAFQRAKKVILIGHSIGCYIILHVMDRLREKNCIVEKGILLFPTIERMKQSPQGLKMTPLLTYARWMFMLITRILRIFPESVVSWLAKTITQSHEKCALRAIMDHFTSQVVDCSTYMALQEMYEVDVRNDRIIEEHIGKLIFYYGATDKWCPVSYYYDVYQQYGQLPESKIHLCSKGYAHAFVLCHSTEVAEMVAEWTVEIEKENRS